MRTIQIKPESRLQFQGFPLDGLSKRTVPIGNVTERGGGIRLNRRPEFSRWIHLFDRAGKLLTENGGFSRRMGLEQGIDSVSKLAMGTPDSTHRLIV